MLRVRKNFPRLRSLITTPTAMCSSHGTETIYLHVVQRTTTQTLSQRASMLSQWMAAMSLWTIWLALVPHWQGSPHSYSSATKEYLNLDIYLYRDQVSNCAVLKSPIGAKLMTLHKLRNWIHVLFIPKDVSAYAPKMFQRTRTIKGLLHSSGVFCCTLWIQMNAARASSWTLL